MVNAKWAIYMYILGCSQLLGLLEWLPGMWSQQVYTDHFVVWCRKGVRSEGCGGHVVMANDMTSVGKIVSSSHCGD